MLGRLLQVTGGWLTNITPANEWFLHDAELHLEFTEPGLRHDQQTT